MSFPKKKIDDNLKISHMESILFILLALVGLCLGWRLVEWHPFLRLGFLGLVLLSLTAAWQWRHIWVKDELSQRAFHQTLPKEGDQRVAPRAPNELGRPPPRLLWAGGSV